MYCVIQKIENKKPNMCGEYKKLESYASEFTIGDKPCCYFYRYTGGRFERPIKTAYRISIHKSYRKDGKVKKKQWVICTIGYYDIVSGFTWIGDHYFENQFKEKLQDIGITEDELCNMVYEKFNPIIAAVEAEFKQTEEYKVKQEHEKILEAYREAKTEFEKRYGKDTYDYCYDVFGTLRNEEYLNQLKAGWDNKQQHESSYYDNFQSNYSNYDFSSYFNSKGNTYTEDEKSKLKKIYKVLAMKFHPDLNNGDSEMMKLVNKLKGEWDI